MSQCPQKLGTKKVQNLKENKNKNKNKEQKKNKGEQLTDEDIDENAINIDESDVELKYLISSKNQEEG